MYCCGGISGLGWIREAVSFVPLGLEISRTAPTAHAMGFILRCCAAEKPCASVEVEFHFDGDFHVDRVAVFYGRLKAPVLDGFDGFFVKAHAE